MLGIIGLGGTCHYEQSVRRLIPSNYYAVAADSGLTHFKALGIVPDLLVGDLDSISDALLKESKKENIIINQYNPQKNYTDSEIAVKKALSHGCESLLFIGAFGNRLDHMLSNQMMAASLAAKGTQVVMTDGVTFMYTITTENSPFIYPIKSFNANEDVFSIIPIIGDAVDISLEGLEYQLINETIYVGSTRAVSNTVKDITIYGKRPEFAQVSVKSGVVLFIYTKSDEFLKAL